MSGNNNKSYAIHPAIGVARMGNADVNLGDSSSYFLSPESPLQVVNEGKDYKTGGKIKKQAQRFRIYEYVNGKAAREITLADGDVASIEWTVQLGNRKAALDIDSSAKGSISQPAFPPPDYGPATSRNAAVKGDRKALCISSGSQTVSKPGTELNLSGEISFTDQSGATKSAQVELGMLHVETKSGRLLVFGGNGQSRGLLDGEFSSNAPIGTYANNDAWYDDISDGSVTATIAFKDGTKVSLDEAEQAAWVICGVPRYAPAITLYTSLYDVARSAFEEPNVDGGKPSFARDIYPVLRAVSMLQWVSDKAAQGHGSGTSQYYLSADKLRLFSDNNPAPDSDPFKARNFVFSKIRNPNENQRDTPAMPRLPTQVVNEPDKKPPWDIASVTKLQYAMLDQWRIGNFVPDGVPAFVPFDQLDINEQPGALDFAALAGTAGTPFYPGIESWRIMRSKDIYAAPLRIKTEVIPGDLSMGNALPWQADYLDCNDAWWPAQRPNYVTRNNEPLQSWEPADWDAGGKSPKYNKMVQHWPDMGFVVSKNNGASYEETERTLEDSPE
jgi:hypothetical protein